MSNIKRLKQPELFIKLARDLQSEAIEFRMIGHPERSVWGDQLLDSMGELDNLTYLGGLEPEQVNAELERANLFVNTSTYEGLPNTFIQAWMREVPTLSLNVDPDGVIADHGLGDVAGTYERLRSKLIAYQKNPIALKDMGHGARQFAIERYSMNNAARILEIIDG